MNCVGGQDELVFDGDSMIFDAEGDLVYRAPQFAEELFIVDLDVPADRVRTISAVPVVQAVARRSLPLPSSVERLSDDAAVYQALVTGLRDYATKNGFSEVIIGSSGGIDSALASALAVDALGPAAVHTLTMPSRYSSKGSVADSEALAANLGCRFSVVPIEATFESLRGNHEPRVIRT